MIGWRGWLRRFLGRSLDSSDFGEIIDDLDLPRAGIFGVPWGADSDKLFRVLPQRIVDGFSPGASHSLFGFFVPLGGHDVELMLTVHSEEGFNHVSVTPVRTVTNGAPALVRRFGKPDLDFERHGERHRVWNERDCVIELTEPGTGVVNLTVQPPYLDDY